MLEPIHRNETQLESFVSGVEGVGYSEGMKYLVTLDCYEDGVWIAECPAIPAVSVKDARGNKRLRTYRKQLSHVLM